MDIKQDSGMPMPHRPGVILIHLLGRCNLFCNYCYMNAEKSRGDKLPFKLVERTIKEANHLGIEGIWLSGGEPFLYPGLKKIIRIAEKEDKLTFM